MLFGLTRGEIGLTVFIFGLIYLSGLLPKVAARLSGKPKAASSEEKDS